MTAESSTGATQDGGEEMEEKSFMSNLHSFMKERGTPIERIPHLGFKQSESPYSLTVRFAPVLFWTVISHLK